MLAFVWIAASLFASWFVNQEQFIYFWDLAGYWMKFGSLGQTVGDAPREALREIVRSVRHDDYNALPILPLLPFFALFGGDRLSYILAVTDLALLPSTLMLSLAVLQTAVKVQPNRHSLSLIFVCLVLQPSLWAAALRGLPDVIGIGVIAVILLVQFRQPLDAPKPLGIVAIGSMLCGLILLRRWYAYWVVSFFVALAVTHLWDLVERRPPSLWPSVRRRLAAGAGLAAVVAAGLFAIATPVAVRMIGTDYGDIHSAYLFSRSMIEAAGTVARFFGWSVLALAACGLIVAIRREESRVAGLVLVVQVAVAFVLFSRTQDFDVHHFYLLVPAIAFGAGFAVSALQNAPIRAPWRIGLTSAVLLLCGLNFTAAFVPQAAGAAAVLAPVLPATRHYPLVRRDLNSLRQLLDRLEVLDRERPGPIYVLASSEMFNSHILEVGCRTGRNALALCGRILRTSDVDKRDGFPREFRDALYVVVASPTQYHLRPEDQRVVGLLARAMTSSTGLANSYERLPEVFTLEGNVTVHLYVRRQPIDSGDLEAVAAEIGAYYPTLIQKFGVGTAR